MDLTCWEFYSWIRDKISCEKANGYLQKVVKQDYTCSFTLVSQLLKGGYSFALQLS